MEQFNGLGMTPGTLWRLSGARSRSISSENFSGAKGEGGRATDGTGTDLGPPWKLSPSVTIAPGETVTLAEVGGPGAIQSMSPIWACTR